MARELYIVSGLHAPSWRVSEYWMRKAERHINLVYPLLENIAIASGATHYFSDSLNQRGADIINKRLDTILSLKGEEADPKAGKDPVEELPEFDRLIIAELVLEVATLASVRMKGVPIKAFYTEDVGDDDLDKIVREGAATDCGLEYISRMLKASGLRFEKEREAGLLHMVGDARDQIIFDNVNRQGGNKNVLRMGSNHKL